MLVAPSTAVLAAAGEITTIAGGALGVGPGTAVGQTPAGIAVAGSLVYVADSANRLVRVLDTVSGNEDVVAGNGSSETSPDGGLATSVGLNTVNDVVVDGAGNILFIDSSRVRRVNAVNGTISTVAGTGVSGFSGDNGPAVNARLAQPAGLALDSAGNLYIADTVNSRIRRVTPGGTITTVAGAPGPLGGGYNGDGISATTAQLALPQGVAVDASGNLYIADTNNDRIRKVSAGTISTVAGTGTSGFSGDGGLATAAALNRPAGVAVSGTTFLIADTNNHRVRQVAGGVITVVAGSGSAAFAGDTGPATAAALRDPRSVRFTGGGFFIADTGNNRVRRVNAGTISTVAGNGQPYAGGDGGQATAAQLAAGQLDVDGAGNIYFVEGNRIRRIDASGVISTIAGTGQYGNSGDGGPALVATFAVITDVATDGSGNVYVADNDNSRIRRIDPGGTVSTYAGGGADSNDGILATAASILPRRLAFDLAGNLIFTDPASLPAPGKCRVRKIDRVTRVITTIAGTPTCGPYNGEGGQATSAVLGRVDSLAVDSAGNIFFGDGATNRQIYRVTPDGTIKAVAGVGVFGSDGDGGPAVLAKISDAADLAVDGAGHLFFTDRHTVRRIDAGTGFVTRVVGTGATGFAGDGGPAATAELAAPQGLDFDPSGRLVISDSGNRRIRRVQVPIPVPPARLVPADMDGDFFSDLALVRASSGTWLSRSPRTGGHTSLDYGLSTDIPVPGDYDGDHKLDHAIFRPSTGLWAIRSSNTGTSSFLTYGGIAGDVPVPSDYDGDGRVDVAIYRPQFGGWYARLSSTNTDAITTFGGVGGDIPVPADYDGDYKTDISIFRPSGPSWFVRRTTGGDTAAPFGATGDIPVPADYDSDRRADQATYRPSTGLWSIRQTSNGVTTAFVYGGVGGDVPVPADYDADGRTDIAIFRPAGAGWYLHLTSGGDSASSFGQSTDVVLALPPAVRRIFYP